MGHNWHTRQPRTRLPASLRLAIMTRDRYRCQIRANGCLDAATDVDHIIPVSQRGSDDPSNLRAACAPCNQWWNVQCRRKPASKNRQPERHPGRI
ncbi:HNH endonuclease [Nocardia brasiliensis]|uniref:HNH endonuclease n=2 Tax=Nocardia brasiliensis TaxID=37326 RepID=UPI003CC7F2B5